MKEIAIVPKSGKLISDGLETTIDYDTFYHGSSGSVAVILDDIPRTVYYGQAGSVYESIEYKLYGEIG